MQAILLTLMLAVTVEGLVEYVKSVAQRKSWKTITLQLGAAAVSILLCIASGADLYAALGVEFSLPFVGGALTGVFASRGANYVSDLIGRLRAAGKKSRRQDNC